MHVCISKLDRILYTAGFICLSPMHISDAQAFQLPSVYFQYLADFIKSPPPGIWCHRLAGVCCTVCLECQLQACGAMQMYPNEKLALLYTGKHYLCTPHYFCKLLHTILYWGNINVCTVLYCLFFPYSHTDSLSEYLLWLVTGYIFHKPWQLLWGMQS